MAAVVKEEAAWALCRVGRAEGTEAAVRVAATAEARKEEAGKEAAVEALHPVGMVAVDEGMGGPLPEDYPMDDIGTDSTLHYVP